MIVLMESEKEISYLVIIRKRVLSDYKKYEVFIAKMLKITGSK